MLTCDVDAVETVKSPLPTASVSPSAHKTLQRSNAVWNGARLHFCQKSKSLRPTWKRIVHSMAFLFRLRLEREKSVKRAVSRKRWTRAGTAVRFKVRLWNDSQGKKRRRCQLANYKVSSKETDDHLRAPSLKRKSVGGLELQDSIKLHRHRAALAQRQSTYAAFLVNTHGNFVKVDNDRSVANHLTLIADTVNSSPTDVIETRKNFKNRLKDFCHMDPSKAVIVLLLAVVIAATVVCVRIFKLFR